MAAINFPSSPTLNQEFLASNNVTYKWNGVAWVVKAGNKYVQSPVRQTVLTGPVDAKGRADFLEIKPDESKFIAKTKNVDSNNPLILSYGDGFSSVGPKDVIIPITQELEWELDNNMDNYLYIDLDDSNQGLPLTFGNVTPGKTQIRPTYFINDNARQDIVRLNPVMTNYTLPYGEVIHSSEFSTSTRSWNIGKDIVDATNWCPNATSFDTVTGVPNGDVFVGYNFENYSIKALEYEVGSGYQSFSAPHTADTMAPTSWKLQGSNDGTDWVDIDFRENITEWTQQVNKRFSVSAPGYYKFYRLLILAMGSSFTIGYCAVGRFHLFGKPVQKLNPVLTDYNAPWGSILFSSEYSASWKAWYAARGITDANAWLSLDGAFDANTGTAITPTYVGYDVGPNNKKKALTYKVMAGYSGALQTENSYPMWWKLEGSNDLLDWTVLDEQVNVTTWTYQQAKEFNVTTPGYYRYYRLNILQKSFGVSHYAFVAIAQFELFGDLNNSFFYPMDHRSRGIVCNDAGEYEYRLRLYVGKVTVANSQITEINSFAYQGMYVSDYFSAAENSGINNFTHNIGTGKIETEFMLDMPDSYMGQPIGNLTWYSYPAINANTTFQGGTGGTAHSGWMIVLDGDCKIQLHITYDSPINNGAIWARRAF